jgi:hypothetical protein
MRWCSPSARVCIVAHRGAGQPRFQRFAFTRAGRIKSPDFTTRFASPTARENTHLRRARRTPAFGYELGLLKRMAPSAPDVFGHMPAQEPSRPGQTVGDALDQSQGRGGCAERAGDQTD